jgi:hypothetical protein
MKPEPFKVMLTGGHPNSLGRTLEVVDLVLENQDYLEELYQCYFSEDEVVRLRTSNALKRISRVNPAWLVPYIDKFINDISKIDQASTQWTLANLFDVLAQFMTPEQFEHAKAVLKHNLATHSDWIVLNNSMQVLADWAVNDEELRQWLTPHLHRLREEKRKSIANRAKKLLKQFEAQ